jgi:hypothetical protein
MVVEIAFDNHGCQPCLEAGLAHRPDVTIRVYDADNHLFFPGESPSTPAEYDPPQHVDPAVVADIAHWLAPRRRNRLFDILERIKP